MIFLFGIAENRKVLLTPGDEIQVPSLVIPEAGLRVYLKEFGWVKVRCQDFKNAARYYILRTLEVEHTRQLNRQIFKQIHDQ